jgi:hypothetical protein
VGTDASHPHDRAPKAATAAAAPALPVFGTADGVGLGGHQRIGERLDHRAERTGTRHGEVVLGEGVQGHTAP